MKERPILFNAAMIRAILAGQKTQTRRIVKQLDPSMGACTKDLHGNPMSVCWAYGGAVIHCPYGQPGDRLWVRETFQGPLWDGDFTDKPADPHSAKYCVYKADGGPMPEYVDGDDNLCQGWRPSIHMPRWASRILLEIVSVRVERLNDISEADARAEGVQADRAGGFYIDTTDARHATPVGASPIVAFQSLWESINGAGSWGVNPWVWVVEFKRIEADA
jgi:hypothetical protein